MDLNDLHLTPDKRRELQRLLDKAHRDYQTNIDNLIDAATDEMETVLSRSPLDAQELVREYASDASQLANDYYDDLRALWSEYSSTPLPDFDHAALVDTDRTLWQVQGGFSDTDFNGLTYQQVKAGRSKAGKTVEDLWPSFSNLDDSQQFISDMIASSTRLTMQRNIRIDPTNPRWARVASGRNPCAFCVMLAGRGFAYTSQETADFGGSFHDGHCHCTIVPSWGANKVLTASQSIWKSMYDAAKDSAATSSAGDIAQAMRRLYPDDLRDGVLETTKPWPDDVTQISGKVWSHILIGEENGKGGHASWAKNPGKTHFPNTWSEQKIKWAIKETVANPDAEPTDFGNRQNRDKTIENVHIRVKLSITKHGYRVRYAYPIEEEGDHGPGRRKTAGSPSTRDHGTPPHSKTTG
jgi:hypothetical protein